jgi:hypothetical protein
MEMRTSWSLLGGAAGQEGVAAARGFLRAVGSNLRHASFSWRCGKVAKMAPGPRNMGFARPGWTFGEVEKNRVGKI